MGQEEGRSFTHTFIAPDSKKGLVSIVHPMGNNFSSGFVVRKRGTREGVCHKYMCIDTPLSLLGVLPGFFPLRRREETLQGAGGGGGGTHKYTMLGIPQRCLEESLLLKSDGLSQPPPLLVPLAIAAPTAMEGLAQPSCSITSAAPAPCTSTKNLHR